MLTYILTDSNCNNNLSPQATGTFFPFVPCRLGVNKALDAAVYCLWHAYCDFSRVGHAQKNTLKAYGKGLGTLRGIIDDSASQTNSETICASIVIQYCEVRGLLEKLFQAFSLP